jgi:cellulase/cellobiase CelA1
VIAVTNIWNGEMQRSGDTVDVTFAADVDSIPPGQSRTQFGYCGSGIGLPSMEPLVGEEPGDETTPEEAEVNFSTAINIYDQWATGFCARVEVTNESAVTAVPPTVKFYLADDVVITTSWNGTYTHSNGVVEVTLPSWIGEMQPGQTSSDFGLCGNGSSVPTATPEPQFQLTTDVYNQWSGGYCLRLQLTNNGTSAGKPANMMFGFSAAHPITSTWGSTFSYSNDNSDVTVPVPSWLADIQPGQTVLSGAGFCANTDEQPQGLTAE